MTPVRWQNRWFLSSVSLTERPQATISRPDGLWKSQNLAVRLMSPLTLVHKIQEKYIRRVKRMVLLWQYDPPPGWHSTAPRGFPWAWFLQWEKCKTGIQLLQCYGIPPRGPLRFHLMKMAWGISKQDYCKPAEDRGAGGTQNNKCVNLTDHVSAASGTWADMPTSSLPISLGKLVAQSTQGTCSVILPSPSLGPQPMSHPGHGAHFTNPNLEGKASQQPCPTADLRFQPPRPGILERDPDQSQNPCNGQPGQQTMPAVLHKDWEEPPALSDQGPQP